MNGDISLDVGSALPYYTEKLLGLFGMDAMTRSANDRFLRIQQLGVERASSIQCIGMPDPIPIDRIYQPSQLLPRTPSEPDNSGCTAGDLVGNMVSRGVSAVIVAGPGRGKTTLLHWLFVSLLQHDDILPMLFTLRLPSSVDDLIDVIALLTERVKIRSMREKLVLLVDGYDEINEDERKLVSKALSEFKAQRKGSFILTCRSFYSMPDLVASRYELAPFSIQDSERFVAAFSAAIGAQIDGERFCSELAQRGFSDFVGHPLMLALACVLKTGPLKSIPSNAIGLIRRALDTLTFRWDESKGLARDAASAVDGEMRQRCLMRIAFECERMPTATETVEIHVRKQLMLEQCEGIQTSRLLDEMARWYGVLVPTASGDWEFVHKALHDYLAARYWVESGRFNASAIERWSTRASYAACLLPDATTAICCALRLTAGLTGLMECLYNRAAFDNGVVAFSIHRAFRDKHVAFDLKPSFFSIPAESDFFELAKADFLRAILSTSAEPSDGRLVLAAYCLAELTVRDEKIALPDLPLYLQSFLGRHTTITVIRRQGPQTFNIQNCVSTI